MSDYWSRFVWAGTGLSSEFNKTEPTQVMTHKSPILWHWNKLFRTTFTQEMQLQPRRPQKLHNVHLQYPFIMMIITIMIKFFFFIILACRWIKACRGFWPKRDRLSLKRWTCRVSWAEPKQSRVSYSEARRRYVKNISIQHWSNVTKYIYSTTKCNFEVLVLYLGISISVLRYTSTPIWGGIIVVLLHHIYQQK